MARMTLDELLRQNIAGAQIFDPLSQRVGIKDWQYDACRHGFGAVNPRKRARNNVRG